MLVDLTLSQRLLKPLFVALGVAFLLAGCEKQSATATVDPNGPAEVVIPEHGAYTGAFMDFGDAEDDVTLETIEDFEQMVGKHQAIIASSSYWGEQNFPDRQSRMSSGGTARCRLCFGRHGTSHTEEDHGPDKFQFNRDPCGQVGRIHRHVGRCRSEFWSSDDCRRSVSK